MNSLISSGSYFTAGKRSLFSTAKEFYLVRVLDFFIATWFYIIFSSCYSSVSRSSSILTSERLLLRVLCRLASDRLLTTNCFYMPKFFSNSLGESSSCFGNKSDSVVNARFSLSETGCRFLDIYLLTI